MALTLSAPTLGKLVSTVRNMLNQPNAANSFWSDAEISDYLNEGIRVYFAEVVQHKEGQWGKTANLDIVSGTETVDLPTDCYQVKTLYKAVSDGYVALPYRNMVTESYATIAGSQGTNSYFPVYDFRENKLLLRPIPQYSEIAGLKLEYIYFPEVLVSAADTLSTNVVPLFKQCVEMYAVCKAKEKESLVKGVDTSSIAKRSRDELFNLMIQSIKGRSAYPQFTVPFSPENI